MDRLLGMKNNYERAKYLYKVAVALENRLGPEFEKFILMSTVEYIKLYAEDVIKGRWPEGEKAILKILKNGGDGHSAIHHAVCYAIDVINDRWPEIESYLI